MPKGPSLDPKVKRLAAEVEDHPIAYASFEGDIPKGQYGAGHVAIFDSGVWSTEGDAQAQLDKGHSSSSCSASGSRAAGTWCAAGRPSRRPQWLLFKQSDEYAAADTEADDLLEPSRAADRHETEARASAARAPATPAHGGRSAKPQPPKRHDGQRLGQRSGWARQAAAGCRGARRRATLRPDAVELQLARLVDEPPQGDEWLHEPKWDGYRILGLDR